MTPLMIDNERVLAVSPSPEEDHDREGTLPVPHAQAYYQQEGTPPPPPDDREGTLPVLSIEEYTVIRSNEEMAVILLSLAVPRRGRGRPRKVRPPPVYHAASYAEVVTSQFMMAALMLT